LRALAPVHNTFEVIKDPRVCFEPLVAFGADEIVSLTLETGEPVSLQECFLKRVDRLAVFLKESLDLCLSAIIVNVRFLVNFGERNLRAVLDLLNRDKVRDAQVSIAQNLTRRSSVCLPPRARYARLAP
jgi:hypothetical protein